jgi:hypothetical protein
LAFFAAAAAALWGVGLARLIPLIRALLACVQEEALAYAADPGWCVEPFTSLATVPLILTGAGFVAALGAFIVLCFLCCCSVRPRGDVLPQQQHGQQPQFLAAGGGSGGSPAHHYQHHHHHEAPSSLPAAAPTYWDEQAGKLVPGPATAALVASGRRASAASMAPPDGAPPPSPIVVPVAAYAPPVAPFVPPGGGSSPLGEPIGSARDYPQVTPSV